MVAAFSTRSPQTHKWVFVSLMHAHILGNASLSLAHSPVRSFQTAPSPCVSYAATPAWTLDGRTGGRTEWALAPATNQQNVFYHGRRRKRTNAASSAMRRLTGSGFENDSIHCRRFAVIDSVCSLLTLAHIDAY